MIFDRDDLMHKRRHPQINAVEIFIFRCTNNITHDIYGLEVGFETINCESKVALSM